MQQQKNTDLPHINRNYRKYCAFCLQLSKYFINVPIEIRDFTHIIYNEQ